jgi:transposase
MIALPSGVQVWLAAGVTDLRKGFDGLSALVQLQLAEDPFSGQLFVFRGRRGDRKSRLQQWHTPAIPGEEGDSVTIEKSGYR